MATFHVRSLSELNSLLGKHARARVQRVERAVKQTAQHGVPVVRSNVPVAFAELEHSIHAGDLPAARGARVYADAPHAAPVEEGSRPHMPPLEPLIAWVKLRGMQGLKSERQVSRLRGATTREHAQSIAGQLRAMERGGALAANAPERIARAIQMAIAKNGTRPHWFMLKSLPTVEEILDVQIKAALPD
ncbi:MAG TPA: hypothetical protein VFT22_10880 [Kofleriaceae bacterium]|nr:hypothetical protein [Kofleriaceae bacterium]